MSHGPTYLGGLGGLLFLLEGGLRALNTIRYYPRRFPFITRVLKPRYLHGPPATLSFARILVLQTQFVELLLGKACLVVSSNHRSNSSIGTGSGFSLVTSGVFAIPFAIQTTQGPRQ